MQVKIIFIEDLTLVQFSEISRQKVSNSGHLSSYVKQNQTEKDKNEQKEAVPVQEAGSTRIII